MDECIYVWLRADTSKYYSESSRLSVPLNTFAPENHPVLVQGQWRSKWQLSIKSYRSTFSAIPGSQVTVERVMCVLNMNDTVFVLLDDPVAPTRADMPPQSEDTPQSHAPTHSRNTFLSLTPPGALEQLLAQLRARWIPVRQTGSGVSQRGHSTGQQLAIDGHVYAIGNDWLVRAGNVVIAGGAVKGMILEAEYLPLPTMDTQDTNWTAELISNLLVSILPNVSDAKTAAVTISDMVWDEVRWDRAEDGTLESEDEKNQDEDDIFVSDGDLPSSRKGDWVGADRERRSAFMVIGALKSEGIL